MPREAPRTVLSLSAAFQEDVTAEHYEIIVVDNNSSDPLNKKEIEGLGENIRYFFHETESQSPVGAIKVAVDLARGEHLGVVVDGARLVTPGIIKWALTALRSFASPFVTTMSWHLGSDRQFVTVPQGYNQEIEDRLLEEIDWQNNGYDLLSISSFAGSSTPGYFQPITESNAVFLPKKLYEAIGGYDPAFDLPAGGYCNLDFYKRACEHPGVTHIVLLGEGSFHQHHGGITTSGRSDEDRKVRKTFQKQYKSLRNDNFVKPKTKPVYLGNVPPQALQFLRQSLDQLDRDDPGLSKQGSPPAHTAKGK